MHVQSCCFANRNILLSCRSWCHSWFATMWLGSHVGGQYNRIFSREIYVKKSLVPRGEKCCCSWPPTWPPPWRHMQTSISLSLIKLSNAERLLTRKIRLHSRTELPAITVQKCWKLVLISLSLTARVRAVVDATVACRGNERQSRLLLVQTTSRDWTST